MDNEHWKLQIDSGYVTRLCINFVAIPVSYVMISSACLQAPIHRIIKTLLVTLASTGGMNGLYVGATERGHPSRP